MLKMKDILDGEISRCCWAKMEVSHKTVLSLDNPSLDNHDLYTLVYTCKECHEHTMPFPKGSREYSMTADVCAWARMLRSYQDDKGTTKICGTCVMGKADYFMDVVSSKCSTTYAQHQLPQMSSNFPEKGKQERIGKGKKSNFARKHA